jgi:two-component system, OmpR family, sensor histidine kinase KdpD
MMDENRADSFLRLIRQSQRGKLKIYLGYCAGVGKTYQMLLEAHHLKRDGIDVAIGLVETHGRSETEALLEGLEIIPRRRVTYHGIDINEMDLDAILLRHPGVVLVDELAHTNVPGSKYDKRYQEIEEILSAGIHVVTTLNVQHLESLYETVERATGVRVRERIPDRVVAEADQLVNVDVTTEDLRRRLTEGKVYTKQRIETALDNFFKPANLEQLRELTLRELASQIDSRRRDLAPEEASISPDQVMVCLSSRGPNSEALLRYGSRLAGRLNRNWYAVYVQTSSETPIAIDAKTQRLLSNTLTLAQQLGATVFTYRGDDIVKTILQFAREYRVGHIVIGAPGKKLSFWRRLRGEVSIVERLMLENRNMTIVVLDTRSIQNIPVPPADPMPREEDQDHGENPEALRMDVLDFDIRARIWDAPMEKEKAMRQLLDDFYHKEPEIMEHIWNALIERENQGGTFVGKNILIPHARVHEIRQPALAVGLAKESISDRQTGGHAKIMILLLTPDQDNDTHVLILGNVSKMARTDQWQRDVLTAENPSDIVEIVRAGLSDTPHSVS